MMKKLAMLLLLAAPVMTACRTTPSATRPAVDRTGSGGATSSRTAVEGFLAAAKAQDIQALSLIWGSEAGPARATLPREELERREIVMLCHLRHDSYSIIAESALLGQQRRVTVDLTQGARTRRTNLVTVPSATGAWYVLSVDLEPLQQFCASQR